MLARRQRAAAGQPSWMKSCIVADSECQLPATARPKIRPAPIRNPQSLMPDAKSRSSAMDTDESPINSNNNQNMKKAKVPSPAEKMLFEYEGPSPRFPPAYISDTPMIPPQSATRAAGFRRSMTSSLIDSPSQEKRRVEIISHNTPINVSKNTSSKWPRTSTAPQSHIANATKATLATTQPRTVQVNACAPGNRCPAEFDFGNTLTFRGETASEIYRREFRWPRRVKSRSTFEWIVLQNLAAINTFALPGRAHAMASRTLYFCFHVNAPV